MGFLDKYGEPLIVEVPDVSGLIDVIRKEPRISVIKDACKSNRLAMICTYVDINEFVALTNTGEQFDRFAKSTSYKEGHDIIRGINDMLCVALSDEDFTVRVLDVRFDSGRVRLCISSKDVDPFSKT